MKATTAALLAAALLAIPAEAAKLKNRENGSQPVDITITDTDSVCGEGELTNTVSGGWDCADQASIPAAGHIDAAAEIANAVITTDHLNDAADPPSEGQLLAVGQTTTELRYVKPPPLCKTLTDQANNLAATDDIPNIIIWFEAVEVTDVRCISTGGTSITITLEDDAGNDLVTSCVCTTSLTDCTLAAGVTFSALERMDWTTDSVSGNVTDATACLEFKYDL